MTEDDIEPFTMVEGYAHDVKTNKYTAVYFEKPKRTLVVADIHGAYRALVQVMERCGYNPDEDQLIFLGDYVDGWSESAEVIEYLIGLYELSYYKPIFILGNHDTLWKNWIKTGYRHRGWLDVGGQSTIDSYIKTRLLTSEEHRRFAEKLVPYYIDDENRAFVHGGFYDERGLGNDTEHRYTWDRDLWDDALLQDEFYKKGKAASIFNSHKEIFIGHTATINWIAKPHYPEYHNKDQKQGAPITVPMNRCNVWNIDTGAGWSGKLTVMDVDTKEYWQSDFVKELYKDEKGRN